MSTITKNTKSGLHRLRPGDDEEGAAATRPERGKRGMRTPPAPAGSAALAATPADAGQRIGGMPSVDLLPQSIRDAHRQRKVRRKLHYALAGLTVVVALGATVAAQVSASAQAQLESAQSETLLLLTERGQFSELIAVQERLALARAAQTVGASTEIDWSGYLRELQATLPAGVELTGVTIDSASPMQVYEQGTGPLEQPRVATLNFTATSRALPDVPVWLDALQTLPAFADAVPNSVTRDDGGTYLVNITMHIGADAFSGRFAADGTE